MPEQRVRGWEAVASGDEFVIIEDTNYDPEVICTVHVPGEHSLYTAEDNAKLIESLPDLLRWKREALLVLAAWHEIGESVGGVLGSKLSDNVRDEIARLRAENATLRRAAYARTES